MSDLDEWEPAMDTAPDAGEYWADYYEPTEVYCEACGEWLGYNYPREYCRGCKPV